MDPARRPQGRDWDFDAPSGEAGVRTNDCRRAGRGLVTAARQRDAVRTQPERRALADRRRRSKERAGAETQTRRPWATRTSVRPLLPAAAGARAQRARRRRRERFHVSAAQRRGWRLDERTSASTARLRSGRRRPVYFNTVSSAYFRHDRDDPAARARHRETATTRRRLRVAVVNEALVRRFFAGQDPIGRQITIGRDKSRQEPADRRRGLRRQVSAAPGGGRAAVAYLPWLQQRIGNMFLELRAGSPAAVAEAVRREALGIDAAVPVHLQTVAERIRESLVTERVLATLAALLACAAAILACAGLYGLLAYTVARQTREIGLRLALGAHPRAVTTKVLTDSLVLTGIGVVFGLGGALALGRFARGLVFQIAPPTHLHRGGGGADAGRREPGERCPRVARRTHRSGGGAEDRVGRVWTQPVNGETRRQRLMISRRFNGCRAVYRFSACSAMPAATTTFNESTALSMGMRTRDVCKCDRVRIQSRRLPRRPAQSGGHPSPQSPRPRTALRAGRRRQRHDSEAPLAELRKRRQPRSARA